MIKFNILTNDWISFPALGGIGVFISGIVNPIINSVKISFWVSVVKKSCMHRRHKTCLKFLIITYREPLIPNTLKLLIITYREPLIPNTLI